MKPSRFVAQVAKFNIRVVRLACVSFGITDRWSKQFIVGIVDERWNGSIIVVVPDEGRTMFQRCGRN